MSGAPGVLVGGLEIALNRYLALEPDTLRECASLEGRVIALVAPGPGWELFLCPHRDGVQVRDAVERPADVRITASPLALVRRLLGRDAGSGVQVEGDAELLARFSVLLARVGFDPEEWLARLLGDGAAHRVNAALGGMLQWGRRTADTLALDTAEYFREETRDLVHRAEVDQWSAEIEVLRHRTERLAARLARLERA